MPLADSLHKVLSEAIHQAYSGPVKIDILLQDLPDAIAVIAEETTGYCPHMIFHDNILLLAVHEHSTE